MSASGPVVVRAPAKLNLFLHVLGRRADGYHDLQTVFQRIDLQDEIRLQVTADGGVRREPPPADPVLAGLEPSQDLTVRAAQLLQRATGCRLGVRIHVAKRIPAGGGLGGGSSDAAAVINALDALWDLRLDEDARAALGLQLGADVPVFVRGRNAWAEGRGERLTPVALPARWFVVLHPPVHVPTAAVFADPALRRDTPPMDLARFLAGQGHNDFEPVVRARYPLVGQALDWLSQHAPARLTGTGACVFAAFEAASAARRVAAAAGVAGWRAWAVRGLD
ncbi:MAG: 4-(cytidine 5-diphospho)-2-C-methyl-D-erythritol kinase [Pseudomonadota bacterium]|jgi:4-diphosphocytidyl-2-C-methyl-D-erythritol kinase